MTKKNINYPRATFGGSLTTLFPNLYCLASLPSLPVSLKMLLRRYIRIILSETQCRALLVQFAWQWFSNSEFFLVELLIFFYFYFIKVFLSLLSGELGLQVFNPELQLTPHRSVTVLSQLLQVFLRGCLCLQQIQRLYFRRNYNPSISHVFSFKSNVWKQMLMLRFKHFSTTGLELQKTESSSCCFLFWSWKSNLTERFTTVVHPSSEWLVC